jgi:hypothetical protein
VLDFVREKRVEYAQNLALGKMQSFEEYRHSCGYIKALDDVESHIAEQTAARKDAFVER